MLEKKRKIANPVKLNGCQLAEDSLDPRKQAAQWLPRAGARRRAGWQDAPLADHRAHQGLTG